MLQFITLSKFYFCIINLIFFNILPRHLLEEERTMCMYCISAGDISLQSQVDTE